MQARMWRNLFSYIAGGQVKWYSHSGKKAKHTLIMWSSKCIPGYYPREMKTSVHTKTCVWLFIALLFSSVTQSCLTLWDPKNCSTPGFPVHHWLPGLAQTHVHRLSDVIQPSHSLSSPSSAFNLSQHQGVLQWITSSHQVAKILELQSFQWIFRVDFCRTDWLGLLAVHGTLKTLLQHHSTTISYIVECIC